MNVLEFLIVLLEFSEQLLGTTALDNQRAFVGLAHSIFPEFIDGHEFGSLLRQLFLNVLGCEDVLEGHPLLLTAQPLINNYETKSSFFSHTSTLTQISPTYLEPNIDCTFS